MSASTDLANNVAQLNAAVTANQTAITAYVAAGNSVDDPNVVAANSQIQAILGTLAASTAQLTAATPAPAAPTS